MVKQPKLTATRIAILDENKRYAVQDRAIIC